MKIFPCLFVILTVFISCAKDIVEANPITYGNSSSNAKLSTDKAIYKPNEKISFSINTVLTGYTVRYRSTFQVVYEHPLTATTWAWQAPNKDYTGYLIDIYKTENGTETSVASIAVDVSSDWAKFPRYGFLSKFGQMSENEINTVVEQLNRYHINGIQFYDWMDKHHQPLAGTVANPNASWQDIARRDTYKSTIQSYITKVHQKGMNAMFYNLCYGALKDYNIDGVKDEWGVYDDINHTKKTVLDLGSFFKSSIYLQNPMNADWQNYLANKNTDVYAVFDFDGFHIDQLGDWGAKFTYNGQNLNLANSYSSFIQAMKKAHPNKRLIMNAVNQYGQEGIAQSPVDFVYTEIWNPNENYYDLAKIIQNNATYSNEKSTVLAAYLNYNRAEKQGTFNTAGVLLANAVIFSFGGSHIELGEHLLGKEYFPNENLQMNDDLKSAMISYYDFLTAYQNLLRDGGTFNTPEITCTNGKLQVGSWPLQTGKVAFQGKLVGNRQVLQAINFTDAAHFDWRDTNGNQTVPSIIYDATLEVKIDKTINKVWVASPDIEFGVVKPINFTQSGNIIKFTLPKLKYWDMIVFE